MKSKAISDELRRAIELRAYLIWESEGKPQGREKEHWMRAEAEILGKKPAKKAATANTNGASKTIAAVKAKRVAKAKQSKPAHRGN